MLLQACLTALHEACLNAGMTKHDALQLFGGTVAATARALGISASAVYQWPDELTTRQENAVLGAAFKAGKLRATVAPDQQAAA